MDDRERLALLESALAQALRPIKGVPFNVVIKTLADHEVIPIDRECEQDRLLIESLTRAAHIVGESVRVKPICRPRPNEVGNDIETYILAALAEVGLTGSRPTSKLGLGQAVGYPDILITDASGRHTYLEAKIYSAKTADSSMRSFYLSPSDRFKVSNDGRHLLMAFEMVRTPIAGGELSEFRAKAFKLVDLYELVCDVKQEFQSDNRRLYLEAAMLAHGPV
ncbi:MAG: hypothetical protein ACXW3D_05980 [Caulobacteraceae bacterium]